MKKPTTSPADPCLLEQNCRRFLLDPGWQEVSLLAYCNSLGLLLILALLCWRGVVRFLGKYYEWAYYVVVNVLLSIVGGSDVDRYAVWLAPVACSKSKRTSSKNTPQ